MSEMRELISFYTNEVKEWHKASTCDFHASTAGWRPTQVFEFNLRQTESVWKLQVIQARRASEWIWWAVQLLACALANRACIFLAIIQETAGSIRRPPWLLL